MQVKMLKLSHLFFILSLIIIYSDCQTTFILKSYSISPNYAKSSSSVYSFPFNAYSTRTGTMQIKIDFPNNFQLTTASDCQIKIQNTLISNTVCSFDSTTNQVLIGNIVISSTYTSIDVSFKTATSKYAGNSVIQFLFYNTTSTALISNSSSLVQIEKANMSCTLLSNTTVTGAATTYTIQFTPLVEIQANSVIQLQLDAWGPYLVSNFGSATATAVCNSQCTISLLKNLQIQLLIYSNLYSSSSSSKRTITLLSARNPPTFNPLNLVITVTASDGTSVYMTGSTTFNATSLNTFSSVVFNLPDKNISATNNNVNLRLAPKNPIGSNTYIRIITAFDMILSFTYNTNNLLTVPNQITNQPSGQILLGNLTRNSSLNQPTLLSLTNFFLTNPPYAQKSSTITFRTEQLINSTYYFMQETTIQIACTVSSIVQSGVKAVVENIGSVTTFNLWFLNINKLVSGSFIIVNFPSQISLNTSSSSCSLGLVGVVAICTVENKTTLKLNLTSNLLANSNITISITKVNNPLTTIPTSSFTIKTYYQDSYSIVDQLISGLTFTAKQVPLRSVTLTPSSRVVNAKTSYLFTIQSTYEIPSLSKIRIKFPSQIIESGQLLNQFLINSTASTSCTFSFITTNTLQFSNLCIKNTIDNLSIIKITLSNITNPNSFKSTDSFIVQIFNSNNLRQQYLNTGIFVTMNQTAKLTYFKVSPTSSIANDITDYTFEINFLIKHYSGDRIIIKFPQEITLSQIYDCNSLTTNLSVSCSKTNSVTLVFILNYNSTVYSNNIKLTVMNFTNHWYSATKTIMVQTTTNDTTYYYQQDGSAFVNYLPGKLTATINNDNNIVLLGDSKITLSISSPFTLNKANDYSLFYLILQVPTDIVPKQNTTCVPSYASALCTKSSAQIFNITSINDFASTMTIKFTVGTTFFQNTSSFDLKLLYSSSIVLSNTELKLSKFCQSPCKQCTTNKTECLSCLPTPYSTQTIYFSFNNSCVSSCPNTYYLISSSNSCGKCNSSVCNTCDGSANTCTSCLTGRFLYNQTCMLVCPSGYYGFNKQCLKCSSPCATCDISASLCLSCVSNYYLDNGSNSSQCVLTCSNTNYLGIDGICKQCISNCKTCKGTLSNCTSCDQTNYQFFSNSCIRNCPSGMYSSSTATCVNCQSPCKTCSSKIICQSCVTNYYLFNKTQCTAQCPNGYIQVVSECVKCADKCATCKVTYSNCTSCPSGVYFYQNDCLTQCPPLTYPYNKTCTKCISPCVTCSSSPQLCLSCIQGLYLLNNSCVTKCPVSGYIIQASICVSCPSNCITCSTSINCNLCNNQNYLLQGSCVSKCPSNYPIVQNRQCFQCSDICLTCSINKENCTSCKINMFKFSYTCLDTCPLGYYSNLQTYECEDGLSNKIVFFPILIISFIIFVFLVTARIFSNNTSLPTVLTSILSLSQISIWIYMIIQLLKPFKQLQVDYTLPIVLVILCLVALLILNITFFVLQLKKMQSDEYVRGWAMNNINFTVLICLRYSGLIVIFKLFRLIYSRFLNMRTLSLPFRITQNIFPLTTTISIICLVLCQIPMIICSFSLIYIKILKDQLFYTSVECLILTIFCAILTLIDIYKSDTYFEQSDYVKTRKYLQKIKDSSFNQLQDNFEILKDQGSVQAQKYQSKTGGKFIFSKTDPNSFKQLYFEEQSGSVATDVIETLNSKQATNSENKQQNNKQKRRINIFDPIKQQDQELYQDIKYTQEQIKTQLQIQKQKRLSSNVHKQHQDSIAYKDQKNKRGINLGVKTQFDLDDNKSVIQGRKLKLKWNNIISHRQQLAKSIFNTFDAFDTKQLQNIIQAQYDDQQYQKRKQDPLKSIQYGKAKKNRRKKKKIINHQGNSQLQKIYLQRLTEKKNYKDIFVDSNTSKYDF